MSGEGFAPVAEHRILSAESTRQTTKRLCSVIATRQKSRVDLAVDNPERKGGDRTRAAGSVYLVDYAVLRHSGETASRT